MLQIRPREHYTGHVYIHFALLFGGEIFEAEI